MNQEMKRRAFITGTIGTLIGLPFVVRHLATSSGLFHSYRYEKEWNKYRTLCDVPVRSLAETFPVSKSVNVPLGQKWDYAIFLAATLPKNLSQAPAGLPDALVVREGTLYVGQTPSVQTVIVGGDRIAKYCVPRGQDERTGFEVAILAKDNQLVPAKEKGSAVPSNRDQYFENLLALKSFPKDELSVGTKWSGTIGRLTPFNNVKTNYEVTGFSEILDRKTVCIQFTGDVPNIAQMPGVNTRKPDSNQTMTNKHSGYAWFDLETGLLVRQEIDMAPKCTGLSGDMKEITGSAKTIIQLFPV